MGFEPTEPFGSTVFKTVALSQTQPSILFPKLENETLSWTFALPPNLASIFSQIGNKSEQNRELPYCFLPQYNVLTLSQDWLLATFTHHSENIIVDFMSTSY